MATKVDGIHNALVGNIDVKINEIHDLMKAMNTSPTPPLLAPNVRRDTVGSLTDTLVAEPVTPASSWPGGDQGSYTQGHVPVPSSSPDNRENRGWAMHRQDKSWNSSQASSLKSAIDSPSSTPYGTPPTVFHTATHQSSPSHTLKTVATLPALDLPQPAIATSDLQVDFGMHPSSTILSQVPSNTGIGHVEKDNAERSIGVLQVATADQHKAFERAVFDHSLTLCTG